MSLKMSEKEWTRAASRLWRSINIGWWYEALTTPLVILGVLAGLAVVASRLYSCELGAVFWSVLGLSVAGAMGFAWYRSKEKWLDLEGAFVRLEADLGLNNQLSTAAAGRGAWPEMRVTDPAVRWHFGQMTFPILLALGFLLLGFLVPIAPASASEPENQPYTWGRLEAEVEELVDGA